LTRIVSGSTITVDGDAGRVFLPGDGSTPDEVAPIRRNRRQLAARIGAGAAAAGVVAVVVRRRRRSHARINTA